MGADVRQLHLPDSGAAGVGAKRNAPSAQRNLEPILAVHDRVLPPKGRALEIASGTGQHIAAFAHRYTGLIWQPTDVNPENLASISAWSEGAENVAAPVALNACQGGWAGEFGARDVICLTNLLHLISEPEAERLLSEVGKALTPGGLFCLYGPFRREGQLVSDGDRAFDASLRQQDPAIGYKDIGWVGNRLAAAGLQHEDLIAMPADNLMLITRRPSLD